jgi:hypothetical protein
MKHELKEKRRKQDEKKPIIRTRDMMYDGGGVSYTNKNSYSRIQFIKKNISIINSQPLLT